VTIKLSLLLPVRRRDRRRGLLSRFEDVAVIGDGKTHPRILLDEQHRRAAAADFGDDTEHRLHDDRRQAQRRLVEKQKPRLRHQAPRDSNHLLLAAR
jgi:hypothetical protein